VASRWVAQSIAFANKRACCSYCVFARRLKLCPWRLGISNTCARNDTKQRSRLRPRPIYWTSRHGPTPSARQSCPELPLPSRRSSFKESPLSTTPAHQCACPDDYHAETARNAAVAAPTHGQAELRPFAIPSDVTAAIDRILQTEERLTLEADMQRQAFPGPEVEKLLPLSFLQR